MNPLKSPAKNFRPNCLSVEDVFFGDSGKGSVVAKFNEILGQHNKKLVSLRFNGGGNAGHETKVYGKTVVTHQLPTGIIKENCTAIISRCMLIHPEDLLTEIAEVKKTLGGSLPGNLLIDDRVTLSLDTHRALESALNSVTTGGKGSTGRGIATGYASHYERISVTMKDLLENDWQDTFGKHYDLYAKFLVGFGKEFNLENVLVATYGKDKGSKRAVGTRAEFLDRLAFAKAKVKKYVSDEIFDLLSTAWRNSSTPITLEGAQGAGLDPYHGVYPDITASRPTSRSINDATYNIILPENISVRVAVMKTTYMSSVGKRVLPDQKNETTEKWIQEAFDEKGRSTGRLRDIYSVSIPIAQYLRRAAGFNYVVATHLDASKVDVPITVINYYIDKATGAKKPYMPYQDELDQLKAHTTSFKGWDGEQVKTIKTPAKLPSTAKTYLAFISKNIAPVLMATTGPDLNDYLLFN